MRSPGEVSARNIYPLNNEDYSCPHCGRQQVIAPTQADFGSLYIDVRQCLNCKHISVDGSVGYMAHTGYHRDEFSLFPISQARPAIAFQYVPEDIEAAYHDACYLTAYHIGAAGAYARRALELILEQEGYAKPVLAQSIEQASKETDPDKKLAKRLLLKLEYIKEIGNFAVHIRRDGELAIVEIEKDEVEACLETIEELISTLYEEPAKSYLETLALNAKLKASGKKEIALPARPAGLPTEDKPVK